LLLVYAHAEVEDVTSCRSFADGGALLTLAMFYLEGIVLFPGDTLPLRVLQPRFLAAVERARHSVEAPNMLGVIHVRARPQDGQVHVASVGTTAEVLLQSLSCQENGVLLSVPQNDFFLIIFCSKF
jgi:Lon protease-like protein